jgi:4-amino-4-deoxy-L-arabinose transferase-like glycosyltransferase
MFIVGLGAIFFGFAVGWIVYRILRLRAGTAALSDLIAILGVIGGAAVIALFRSDVLFGWYSIGLVIGFFAYFAVGLRLYGQQEVQPWRMEQIPPTSMPATPSNTHPDTRDAS